MNLITNFFDKTLIPEWRKALAMLSVQWNGILVVATPLWIALSEEQKQSLLSILGISGGWYVAAAFLITIVLKLKAQPKLHAPKE